MLNWSLLKNPVNYLIVFLMISIGMIALSLLSQQKTQGN